MRVRIHRKALLAASALFLGCCLVIYLIIEMTLYDHKDIQVSYDNQEDWKEEASKAVQLVGNSHGHSAISSNISSMLQSASWQSNAQQCSALASPNADIQMFEVYKDLKFDNVDGGVWKQGWNIEYSPEQWSNRRKLRVYVVPHSHNDPGWLKTFEDYYKTQTSHILNNMVTKLAEDHSRKFIWAEMSFFSMWWDAADEAQKIKVKEFVQRGQLEFVTAGWVMNDEANTHYSNMISQLTHGHQWLMNNLGVKPRNSWSIDPFGQSPSMAFLLQRAGFSNLLVQRVHYSVKKAFAKRKQLEFRWRQPWDTVGNLDLFTHMMPFYSYDVPHTCGPDPKICCQFDFKRLPGSGVSCPWKVPPRVITKANVAERAELLLDQYRKKAQLYQSNVVLAPLGDDFRYDHASEWDNQFSNYKKIFEYLNSKLKLNVQAQFGTLDDYFQAVREERGQSSFPTLSGDFFTYADRDDHYWSGYYTSRPFYKRMDRVVMSYLRSAELIFTLAWSEQVQTNVPAVNSVHSWLLSPRSGLISLLDEARKQISLFQHHDGVTGTARDLVVEDYGKKMHGAIKNCQHVIQMSAFAMLTPHDQKGVPESDAQFFSVDDIWQDHRSLPEKMSVTLGVQLGVESRRVVLFNSLSWKRQEVIYIQVSTPFVKVTDSHGQVVECQINPVFQPAGISESRYELVFVADVAPLALTTYLISLSTTGDPHSKTKLSTVRVMNTLNQLSIPEVFHSGTLDREAIEFSVQSDRLSAAFNAQGLLKAVTLRDTGETVPLHLDFAKYGARMGAERSGAYLFLPDGEAHVISLPQPLIKVVEGPVLSRVEVDLPGVTHSVTLLNGPGLDSVGLEITNKVDITQFANFEMIMRISSNIHSGDTFYTDLNGLQVVRRTRLPKLPLQGNYYPLPSQIFIEDEKLRLSVLSAQPLGTSSRQEGQIEIMQDRRLMQDDNRGLGQGVDDNRVTRTSFRLLLEKRRPSCPTSSTAVPAGSLPSQLALQSLLHPIHKMVWLEKSSPVLNSEFSPVAAHRPPDVDVHVVSLRTFASLPSPGAPGQQSNQTDKAITGGLVLHRLLVDQCFSKPPLLDKTAQPGETGGTVILSDLFPNHFGRWVQPASLSFLYSGPSQDRYVPQPLCAMDMSSCDSAAMESYNCCGGQVANYVGDVTDRDTGHVEVND